MTAPCRCWEDIELGETTRSTPIVVDEAEMLGFSRKYDPQYFHTDPVAAKDHPFGGLVGSGLYTAALWRIMDHEVNGDIDFVCGVAWDNVKFRRPVRPGDTLYATSECRMKRLSGKSPDHGVITLHHEVVRADGEVVLAFDSVDLVRRRPAG